MPHENMGTLKPSRNRVKLRVFVQGATTCPPKTISKPHLQGESQANRKYLAFAAKAEAEGFPQIARLFRAAAAAETVHALSHLRVMKGVGDTKQNLQAAIDGEDYEFKEMYPGFIEIAKKEGNQAAVNSFRDAMEVEKTHHDLYCKALESLTAGKTWPRRPSISATCAATRRSGRPLTSAPSAVRPSRSSRKWPRLLVPDRQECGNSYGPFP